ncbi:uncharacterized protein FOMMEDRAFT_98371, partial [Fomitiporia mediterranea MF3/22]
YSQAKIKLFRLFCTLYTLQIHLIRVRKLVVEMDTVYVKGIINNLDLQLNATINRWIVRILLFNFEFQHILALQFACTNRLSQHLYTEANLEEEDDFKEWINQAYTFCYSSVFTVLNNTKPFKTFPTTDYTHAREYCLRQVKTFLETCLQLSRMENHKFTTFVYYTTTFFVKTG